MTNKILRGKLDAGKRRVWFDEREIISAKPRHWGLLYKGVQLKRLIMEVIAKPRR